MDGGRDDEWEDASFLDELFRKADGASASSNPNPAPSPAPIPTYDPFAAAPHPSPSPASALGFSPQRELTWEDASFLDELFRKADGASASSNPNPAPSPAPIPTYDPFAAAPHPSPSPASALGFSPPRELTQRPPLPRPAAAARVRDELATEPDFSRGFSPPRELFQRSAVEEGNLAIIAASGSSAGDHRFVGTGGGGVGAKRDREARELERLKRELNRVSKQMNELKNECTELRKDRTKKDLQIKAKEVEIQNLKKANVGGERSRRVSAGMDDGLDDKWEDASFFDELFRKADEASASRKPNPAPTPAPTPTYDPFAPAPAPVSYLPAGSVSYLPAAPHPSPSPASVLDFSPPRELTPRPPFPRPTASARVRDEQATEPDVSRRFYPPRELFKRPAVEEGNLAIIAASGSSAGDHRFVGTGGGGVGAKRDREARELERLKRELNRVSKQMNELKNECTELRKGRTKKDRQIKAKKLEIQNLKKANVSFASKDVCSAGMDIDRSFHAPANGALHAGGYSGTSTRRTDKMNDKDVHSLRDDLYLRQGHQTDLPEALVTSHHTMIDNGISTSGLVSLEDDHFEPRNTACKETKAIGVQTDNTSDNERLECNVLAERISSY